ncbi:hypothetical protein GA0116948_10143 [Chitinophaga costaii]|uniref:Uncharacterized protein n=1 Tax=Chitinophaga costaii TaxID=1335309 RepID=A0A1C3YQA0_9BACT|nr:hypothetical protein GA0116948_10143 [Chitinophaga costaii]
MIYLEWNEYIAKLFFKPKNVDCDVLFYIIPIKYS